MKPTGPIARRSEYAIERVPHGQARALIAAFHYSGGASNTSVHAHGMFRVRDRVLVGSVLWLPPTAKAAKGLARRLLGDEALHSRVLTLPRCAALPGAPKNLTGMMIAASERLVRLDDQWALLVTYADDGEHHAGTIYRATGWVDDGWTKPEARWRNASGRLVSRHSKRGRTIAQMHAAGCYRDGASKKRRFYKFAASTLSQVAA